MSNKIEREVDQAARRARAKALVARLREAKKEFERLPLNERVILPNSQLDDGMNFFSVRDKILRTELGNDTLEDEEVLFHKLADFYDKIIPNWRVNFNTLNEANPRYGIEEEITKEEKVRELLENVEGSDFDNMSLVAVCMYLSNKLAHEFGVTRDRIVEDELRKFRAISGDAKSVSQKLKNYFKAKAAENTQEANRQEDLLKKLGINGAMLERFEQLGLGELVSEEIKAFALKDAMMMTFIDRVQARENNRGLGQDDLISYGMLTQEDGQILVVDLPFYGQFSVHMQTPETISAMRGTPYKNFVYSLESVMLTEGVSQDVNDDLKRIRELEKKGTKTASAIQQVARDRLESDAEGRSNHQKERLKYQHHLALKYGKGKKTIDTLYKEDR